MPKRVLLISPDQRRSLPLQVALLRSGLMVEVTDKLRRALAIIRNRPPTAVVIDGFSTSLDGDQIADMLKQSSETAQLPIFVLRSEEERGAAPRAREVGPAIPRSSVRPAEQRLMESLRAAILDGNLADMVDRFLQRYLQTA